MALWRKRSRRSTARTRWAASLTVSTLALAALTVRIHQQSRWLPVGAALAAVVLITLVVAAALLTIPAPLY